MHKTLTILLLMLWTFGGAIHAAQQAKPNPSAKLRSACGLVSKAEIEQAIGTTLGNPMQREVEEANICTYENAKGNKVKIYLARAQGERDLSTLVDEARKALPQAKVQEFPGLGEKALLVNDPRGATILSVYRDGDSLVVSVYGIRNGAKAEAAVESIAKKAFSRF
jgi:hypothetical protein